MAQKHSTLVNTFEMRCADQPALEKHHIKTKNKGGKTKKTKQTTKTKKKTQYKHKTQNKTKNNINIKIKKHNYDP